jgi:acetylornithine/succinyldiaminopimelate/putrescine aminotransferase
MNEFKSWEEMSVLEQYACQFWDMYKDAYGVRPRGIDTSSWTEADFEAEFVSLSKTIEQENAARVAAEEQAMIAFEMRVQSLMTSGAKSYEMALRWVHEAEGSNGDEEYLCFLVGLPYGYFRQQTPVDAREYAELAADLDAISYGVA